MIYSRGPVVFETVEKHLDLECLGRLRNGIAFFIGQTILGMQISDEKFGMSNYGTDFCAHRELILLLG